MRRYLALAVILCALSASASGQQRWPTMAGRITAIDPKRQTFTMSAVTVDGRPSGEEPTRLKTNQDTEYMLDERPTDADGQKVGFGVLIKGQRVSASFNPKSLLAVQVRVLRVMKAEKAKVLKFDRDKGILTVGGSIPNFTGYVTERTRVHVYSDATSQQTKATADDLATKETVMFWYDQNTRHEFSAIRILVEPGQPDPKELRELDRKTEEEARRIAEQKKAEEPAKAKEKEQAAAVKSEQAAAAKLKFAKQLIEDKKPEAAIYRLERIIKEHPDSEAASEAKKLLEKLK